MNPPRQPKEDVHFRSAGPSGYLVAAAVLLLVAPLSLLAWAAGAVALQRGARRWTLALAGLVPGAVAAAMLGRGMATHGAAAILGVLGPTGTPLRPSISSYFVATLIPAFGQWAIVTAPLGIPAGLVAAAIPPRAVAPPPPEWGERERRAAERAEVRARKRVARRADREGADPRSTALAVSLGGNVAAWRVGDLVVPPRRQLDYAMLLQGAPGVGKSTAISRLTYLAGQERRHLVVFDAKGGHDGLAEGVVAAYLAAWPGARARLFPQERLDIWRGGAQAVVNRLLQVWDWSLESQWYAEVAVQALRLALGQRGPECRSGAELVARLDPGRLQRAWDHDPLVRDLVRSMASDLPGVQVRVGNLVAALSGALDGEASWEDGDLWVVTVPAMVASRDADAALRVLMSDYAHFTMARKLSDKPSHLIVDEFAAIAGGRRVVIDLLERGRGARAGVTLSGQSSAAFGSEEERARLFAAVNAVLAFRSPSPAEIAGLAGSERVAEGAWSFDADQPQARRVTVTARARGRVDQDAVRQLPVGEAELIVGGMVERVRVIRTAIPRAVLGQAKELVAGKDRPPPMIVGAPAPHDRPADTVATRVPAPPSPRQGQAAPRSPSASLDPPPAPRVRRHRPAGPGTDGSPGGDRDNRGE